MNTDIQVSNREREISVFNGSLMLPPLVALLLGDIALFIYSITSQSGGPPNFHLFLPALLMFPVCIILLKGFFTLQPNEARVLILFGAYKGTVRRSGQ